MLHYWLAVLAGFSPGSCLADLLLPGCVQVALPEKETSKPAIAASARPDAKAYSFDACLTGSTTQVLSSNSLLKYQACLRQRGQLSQHLLLVATAVQPIAVFLHL